MSISLQMNHESPSLRGKRRDECLSRGYRTRRVGAPLSSAGGPPSTRSKRIAAASSSFSAWIVAIATTPGPGPMVIFMVPARFSTTKRDSSVAGSSALIVRVTSARAVDSVAGTAASRTGSSRADRRIGTSTCRPGDTPGRRRWFPGRSAPTGPLSGPDRLGPGDVVPERGIRAGAPDAQGGDRLIAGGGVEGTDLEDLATRPIQNRRQVLDQVVEALLAGAAAEEDGGGAARLRAGRMQQRGQAPADQRVVAVPVVGADVGAPERVEPGRLGPEPKHLVVVVLQHDAPPGTRRAH